MKLFNEQIDINDRVYLIDIKHPEADKYEGIYVLGYDYKTDVKETIIKHCGVDTVFAPYNPIEFCTLEEFIKEIFKKDQYNARLAYPIIWR